jgi:parallel beta-helix repeat protein
MVKNFGVTLILTVVLMLSLFAFQHVKAESNGTVYIRADGSIEGTDKIHRDGDVYTLMGDISGGIQVQKSYVVIDGAGYTVEGRGGGRGIDLSNWTGQNPLRITNVTVKNVRIIIFDHGIDGANSYDNTFIGNYVANCSVGIWLIGSENGFANNTITLNTLENNTEGIHIDYSGKNNVVTENNLINNGIGIYVFLSPQPIVDRNYWSDYLERYPNAKEIGNSGIWDTPYDRETFADNHPLVKPVSNQWLHASNIMSFEEAIEAVNKQDLAVWNVSSSLTGQPDQNIFGDDTGFSGYLIWLAPNGTYYEAEFPTGNLLGEIGYLHGEHSWNPPEGFYIWHLNYENIEAYWVLAHNGTIVRAYTLRGSGPVHPFSEIVFYGLIAAVIVAVGLGLLIYFTKFRKKAGKE